MRTKPLAFIATGLAVAVVLVLAGSYAYWNSEGQPGTPDDFRAAVAEAGLDVTWENAGPKAGSGTITADCGPVVVDVDLIDDDLWVRWNNERALLDTSTLDSILRCRP